MPDIAQARAEKASKQRYRVYDEYASSATVAIRQVHEREQKAHTEGYVLGWTESQREPISDAEVEAACAGAYEMWPFMLKDLDCYLTEVPETRRMMRAALTAAAQARVSAESEKG